jgi:hypothetical protein
MNKALSLVLLIPLAILWHAALVYGQQCTYVDPQSSMSGYQAWCHCMRGTPYNDSRGTGCDGVEGDSGASSDNSNQGTFWRWLKERRNRKRSEEIRHKAHNLNEAGVAAFGRDGKILSKLRSTSLTTRSFKEI